MQSAFKVEDPDSVVFTLRVTMPLREWMQLREQLQNAHPSWQLSSAITQAGRAFRPDLPPP